ncbi:MAG: asparagine synthase-related protein, partial [Rhodospirillales bacterium]|nr:asparagine synthase-related protein [Rhodospirillales bacterium]
MALEIKHRGPDQTGHFISGQAGLAMNRLSVIDLAGGGQPMISADSTVAMVFNGEIYNFRALRRELEKAIEFRTASDTEVILNGYLTWGLDVFAKLNGMFAVALWDGRRRRMVLARDAVGVKPLHFMLGRKGLVFSSELKSFTKTGIARTADYQAIVNFLCAGYVFSPRTALQGVRQLAPGTAMVVDEALSAQTLTFRPLVRRGPTELTSMAAIREAISDTVVRQTVADVPYGLLLSAGLDSMSILAALRGRGLAENLRTFTVDYEEGGFSERDRVARLAKEWGFSNDSLLLSSADVKASLPSIF